MNEYSFKLNKFGVTHQQHRLYKNIIDETLSEIYPDKVSFDGVYYIVKQNFDKKGADISIVNRAIGNIALVEWIVRNFNLNSFDELIEFIRKHKISLFKAHEIYFDAVLQILKRSERKGLKNEKKAIQHIKSYLNNKNIEFKIRQTPLYSKQDVIDGIDIILTINNKEWYVQVKPLRSYIIGETYEVISSGKIKKYNNIHYYIFVNSKECLLVANKDLLVKNGLVYVSEKSIKN
jgi:galactitol-specific phosphotransferase system IIB component